MWTRYVLMRANVVGAMQATKVQYGDNEVVRATVAPTCRALNVRTLRQEGEPELFLAVRAMLCRSKTCALLCCAGLKRLPFWCVKCLRLKRQPSWVPVSASNQCTCDASRDEDATDSESAALCDWRPHSHMGYQTPMRAACRTLMLLAKAPARHEPGAED